MGKLSTVVYDAVKHVPVIVRTRTSSPAERFGVIDAVAAFANHCESLQGIARSNVHVSALWGGPPYVTYQVVRSRYRVIVMWVDAPGDFDTVHEVQDALVRLHKAVSDVADGMMNGDAKSFAHAYRVAGAVLEDDYVYSLDPPAPTMKKTSLLKLPGGSASGRPASAATADDGAVKKGGFLRSLFGSGKPRHDGIDSKSADSPESNALSALENAEDMPFDESPESLACISLPDEVFAFSDFGAPLSQSAANLAWVAKLIQGIEKPKSKPAPPIFRRATGVPSTVEGVRVEKGIAGASGSASGSKDALPGRLRNSQMENPVSFYEDSASEVEPPSQSPSMISSVMSTAAALPSAPSGVIAPVVMAPSPSPTLTPAESTEFAQGLPTSPGRSGAEIADADGFPPQVAAGSTHTAQAALNSGPNPQAAFAAGSASQHAPPPLHSSSNSVASPDMSIPEQLRPQHDDFDVANLGGVRDSAAADGLSRESSSSVKSATMSSETSRAVRAKMNEFANTMQGGNYPLALQQVIVTLQGLSRIQPSPQREIVTCSSYVLALKVLIRIRVLETEQRRLAPNSAEAMRCVLDMAMLSMFLAESKHLLPRHSIAGKKMAVEKNFVAGNFGMSARWLRSLLEAAPPPQKPAFAQRLQLCLQNRELNTHMPASKWLCFNSLVVVPRNPIKCGFCPAVFSPACGIGANRQCPVCYVGSLAIHQA